MTAAALVADDQELSRIALAAILQRRIGVARVVEAASLDEALEVLASDAEVALALVDLVMPGIASAADLGAIREGFPSVKLVVVSASTDREDVLLALRCGVHGFVRKDAGVAEIADAIGRVVRGQVYVPADLCEVAGPARPARTGVVGAGRAPAPSLTPRQEDVLRLLSGGRPTRRSRGGWTSARAR